jgi:hypothetical protein
MKTNDNLTERITAIQRIIDRDFGGNRSEFARRVNLSPASITRALDINESSDRRLARIEHAVDRIYPAQNRRVVESYYSKGVTGGLHLLDPLEASAHHQELAEDRAVRLPVYDVTAGAGDGGVAVYQHAVDEYVIDLLEIHALYHSRPVNPFAITVVGESMESVFRSGDRIVVEPLPKGSQSIPAAGIYVFRVEDLIEVKQLERRPGRKLHVRPANPRYGEYVLDLNDDTLDFELIGRVWGNFQRR